MPHQAPRGAPNGVASCFADHVRNESIEPLALALRRPGGEIDKQHLVITKCGLAQWVKDDRIVLDRTSITREQARQAGTYRSGQVLELRTYLTKQGLARGDMGKDIAVERGKVVLAMRNGTQRVIEPWRRPPNLTAEALILQ